jgi:hypothetical protein
VRGVLHHGRHLVEELWAEPLGRHGPEGLGEGGWVAPAMSVAKS